MLIEPKRVCTNCGELAHLHLFGAETSGAAKLRGFAVVPIGDNKVKLCQKAPRPTMRRRKSFTTHPIGRLSR